MITVRCFDSFAAARHLRDEADALNRDSTRPDPFSTFTFFETFHRHDESHPEGRGLALWLLGAFRGERLVGYVALRQVTRRVLGFPVSTVGFLVTRDTDRPHVVARAEDLHEVGAAFYAHLLARRREWSFLEFQQQDASSPLWPPPAGTDLSGHLVRSWTSLENGTVAVRWATLREYFRVLPKKFRSNLARQLEALFDAGRVELLRSSDPLTTPALLELYLGIEPSSWKSHARATIARHPLRIDYFRSLLDDGQPMRVSIQVMLLDGVPIAGLVTGAFLDGLYALHIVYDERLARLAPGSTMLLLGMREAIDGRYAFFNLLSGFGYYKTRWLAEITETHIAQIYRRGSLAYWRRLAGDAWRKLRLSAGTAAAPNFNPARREVNEHAREPAASAPPEERARIDALVARVRLGRGEFLSASELGAALPLRPAR